MDLKYDISGAQTDGARDYQEDSFLTSYIQAGENGDQVTLIIVADGMGGHAAGNVASNLAVQSFNQYITTNYPSDSVSTLLKNALDEANKAIAKTIRETAALKGMGCTIVAALFIEEQMYWISVGDSHLFHIQDNVLIKKNADHSYGGYLDRMAAEGNQVKDSNGYSRHMLLSALTGESIPAIDCPEQPVLLKNCDQILLCSDGIDTLDQNTILSECQGTKDAKELTKRLLRSVEDQQQPRQDNTTILAACLTSKLEPEIAIAPLKTENDVDYLTNKITSPTNFQKPLAPSIEAKLNKAKTGGSSFFSWLFFFVVLSGLGMGAWLYLNENKAVIPELLREQEHVVSSPIPPVVTTQEVNSNHNTSEHKIIKFRDELSSGNYSPEMVWVPAGSFNMGASGTYSPVNEQPRHKVTLNKFAISSKEITRGEFSKYSGIAVSNTNKNQPVRNISWETAKKYTEWLSKQASKTYRLPSEAEWEYAARAGTQSPYWWGHQIGIDNALCVGCTSPLEPTRPNDVGSYATNAFGLYDTAGNVAEWVEDCYHGNYNNAPSDGSIWDSENCKERVVRGGSYFNATKSLFVSRRDKMPQRSTKVMVGFRIVREE